MSQVKKPVIKEMNSKTKKYQANKLEFIKNPSVLEFLGLPGNTGYSEAILEKAIINHLQQFLLELGKGFAFIERQQLVRKGNEHLFATKYKLFLPTEDELRVEIEKEKELIRLQLEDK